MEIHGCSKPDNYSISGILQQTYVICKKCSTTGVSARSQYIAEVVNEVKVQPELSPRLGFDTGM